MVTVKPFRGLRPKKELAEKVASHPYDVLNSAEAREAVKNTPCSFLHVVKPEVDLPEDIDIYNDAVYEKARENFEKMRSDGVLVQDERPCFYIYRQIWKGHEQYGIVGRASADEYNNDIIKKHEHTRKKKEDDRTRHVITLKANTGPVFLTYRDNNKIDEIIADFTRKNNPDVDFTKEDDIQHTVWVVRDEKVNADISRIFDNDVEYLYVADGHHRSASAARAKAEMIRHDDSPSPDRAYNYFLSVFFPAGQLKILDYNRVLFTMNGLSTEEFMKQLEKSFTVKETGRDKPEQPKEFGLYIDGTWHIIEPKPGTWPEDDPVNSLDVAILQNNLLTPVLGIGNPKEDENIDFVGGIRGTDELKKRVNSGECTMAFSLYHTGIDQLMNVADAGKVMPPKSTWFEPKLRSGLVVHLLDD